MATVPNLDHLKREDFERVYEPAEDTYLFLDAMESQQSFLEGRQVQIALEIGPGSGALITFVSSLLPSCFCMAIDINEYAARATQGTAHQNQRSVEVIQGSLVDCLQDRSLDLLLFNPPYVPSEPEEMNSKGIEAAWAGGAHGREVIDILLPKVSRVLSEKGCFYLLLERQNKPKEVVRAMRQLGFSSKMVMEKKAFNEHLFIYRFRRQ